MQFISAVNSLSRLYVGPSIPPIINAMNVYQQPLTGQEKRLSGLQRIQRSEFQKKTEQHERNLQSMKSSLDCSPPKVTDRR